MPTTETLTSDAPRPKVARFVNPVLASIRLGDPIEFDGSTYDEIRVVKLSLGAFRAHTEAERGADILGLPMFEDQAGRPVPPEVMHGLALPDANALSEAAQGFLNRSLRDEAPTPASA